MKSAQSKKHAKKIIEISNTKIGEISTTIIEINKIFELNIQETISSSSLEKSKKNPSFLLLISISYSDVKI